MAVLLFPASLVVALTPAAALAADAEHGAKLYAERCTACHSLDYNGVGPRHRGVVGRAAASVPDFPYSPALKASGLTWTEANLERWLADPEKLVPGQKMGFMVTDATERADLIAYLRQQSATSSH